MSSVTFLAAESVIHAQGILDTVNGLADETLSTIRIVGTVVATGVALWVMSAARFAMGRVITAGLAAGIVVFFLFNITEVSDRVEEQIAAPPLEHSQHLDVADGSRHVT